jgi:hypothetical protein
MKAVCPRHYPPPDRKSLAARGSRSG